MSTMKKGLLVVTAFWLGYAAIAFGQGSLSSQVLRLLDRANTWSLTQTFTLDPVFAEVHTAAPGSTLCDAVGETGLIYYDSTNDNLYWCSGASGWRKIATAAP